MKTAERSHFVRRGGLRPCLDHGHGHRRASGRDRSAGGLEVVEAVEVLVESTLEVSLVPLDSVQVLRVGETAGESPPLQGLLVAAGQVLVLGLAVVGVPLELFQVLAQTAARTSCSSSSSPLSLKQIKDQSSWRGEHGIDSTLSPLKRPSTGPSCGRKSSQRTS